MALVTLFPQEAKSCPEVFCTWVEVRVLTDNEPGLTDEQSFVAIRQKPDGALERVQMRRVEDYSTLVRHLRLSQRQGE